jgi:hypothetical protein
MKRLVNILDPSKVDYFLIIRATIGFLTNLLGGDN